MSQKILSCHLHDYIEIACMYNYQVKLQLKNGESIVGQAKDIYTSHDKREYLIIDTDNKKIELTQISKMNTITPNAKFNEIIF